MRSLTAEPSLAVEVGIPEADDINEFRDIKLGAESAHEPNVCSRLIELGRNGVIAAATIEVDDVDELNEEFDGDTIIEEEHEEGDVEVVDETLGGMSIVWLSLPNLSLRRFF